MLRTGIDQGPALACKTLKVRGSAGVKLWLAGPIDADAVPENLWNVLSTTEKDRADRFVQPADRALFIAARGLLRCLLSEATNIAAKNIRFAEGPSGKPYLALCRGPHFNVSHSGQFALIGLSERRPVGVDIERMRFSGDELSVAQNYFSAAEYNALLGLEQEAMLSVFYKIWTCKEAVFKACGAGISGDAKSFTVKLKMDGFALHAGPHCFPPALASVCAWPVAVPAGYAGCCAVA
jgi:4'-phosphopantetheinyl transferase